LIGTRLAYPRELQQTTVIDCGSVGLLQEAERANFLKIELLILGKPLPLHDGAVKVCSKDVRGQHMISLKHFPPCRGPNL
jgi:hypothetical protein